MPKGENTAYNQQYRALRRQGVNEPKSKRLFCENLLPLIQHWTQQHFEILLMLDANDTIGSSDFGKFLDQTELYYVLGNHHSAHSPPTYIRGTRTIDFLLGTKNVIQATKKCGMTSFNEGITSDHRALWADIDIPSLFKGSVPAPNQITQIPLRTTQKMKIRKIRRKAIHLFKSLNIRSRLDELLQSGLPRYICYYGNSRTAR